MGTYFNEKEVFFSVYIYVKMIVRKEASFFDMKNDVGLKNIAYELNLSVTAVSRALRDCDDISDAIKEKVREKAIELNYIPLSMIKNMKKGPTKILAILVSSLKSPYFGMINELLIEELKLKGYRAIIIPTNSDIAGKENIKEALDIRADGILSYLIPNKDAFDITTLHKLPFLLFGRYDEQQKMNCIYMNDYMGGQIACEFLVNERKCKKLCYIGLSFIECDARRKAGFIDKAKQLGVEYVCIEDNEKDEKVKSLIEQGYNGFFCFDDQIASFIVKYQNDYDVSIVGFNGVSRFYEYAYNITSIEADYSKMVKDAIDVLINQIENRKLKEKVIESFDTKLYIGNT